MKPACTRNAHTVLTGYPVARSKDNFSKILPGVRDKLGLPVHYQIERYVHGSKTNCGGVFSELLHPRVCDHQLLCNRTIAAWNKKAKSETIHIPACHARWAGVLHPPLFAAIIWQRGVEQCSNVLVLLVPDHASSSPFFPYLHCKLQAISMGFFCIS